MSVKSSLNASCKMNTMIRRHTSGKLAAIKHLGQPYVKSQQTSINAFFFSDYSKMAVNDPSKTVYKQVGQSLKVVAPADVRSRHVVVDFPQLKAEMEAVFGERVTSQVKFDRFMKERLSIAPPHIISTILRQGVGRGSKVAVTKKHLPSIARRIAESALIDRWDYVHVAHCFSGLRTLDIQDPGMTALLDALISIADKLNELDRLPDSQNVSMSMSGFQNIHFSNRTTSKLAKCMSVMVKRCSNEFTAQSIGSCLLGLKKMTRMLVHERNLLQAITGKIAASSAVLDSQALSNALYGLQGFSNEQPEVIALLRVLLPKIVNCHEDLNAQGIGNSLYGLHQMSNTSPEVTAVVGALAAKVRSSNSALDAQGFSNAMYGLRCMDSNTPEVLEVLDALTEKITVFKISLTSLAVGNAVYGMKCMSSDAEEVCAMLSALVPKIEKMTYRLDMRDISSSFYGMKEMSEEQPAVANMIVALTKKLVICTDDLNNKGLFAILYGLLYKDPNHPAVSEALLCLAKIVESSKEEFTMSTLRESLRDASKMGATNESVIAVMKAVQDKMDAAKLLYTPAEKKADLDEQEKQQIKQMEKEKEKEKEMKQEKE